jgi:hypothetical protein
MDPIMPSTGAHPHPGEEVMAVDDADVEVSRVSIGRTLALEERMGNHD